MHPSTNFVLFMSLLLVQVGAVERIACVGFGNSVRDASG